MPLSSITSVNKKGKKDRESRLAKIKEGREDRGKFGQRIKDDKLGKTNKEKRKNKSFMMIRHKVNKKIKRSYKDKQVSIFICINFRTLNILNLFIINILCFRSP